MITLNKRQRKFLSPAIKYRWEIKQVMYMNNHWYWDADKDMRCAVGPVCQSLIDAGILRRLRFDNCGDVIRLTGRGDRYGCQAKDCQRGYVYPENYYALEFAPDLLPCSECNGTAVSLTINPTAREKYGI